MKKRLGLYATYEKEGVLADYILYCLKEYRQLVDELIVVSNQVLSEDSKKKIEFVDRIYERSDVGYDVGAFADTLANLYGWENVDKFDEIIFMNDSIIGPLYSMKPLFEMMDSREELDFWGLTTRAKSDFDGGEKIYPEHIQLYLYVIRSKMLHSKAFRDYWDDIMYSVTDFRSAITNYEFDFTKHFEELGFKWDVAVKLPGYYTDNPRINLSPYHYNCYELVKSGKYPFIKRKLFTGDFVFSKYSDKSDLRRTFDYIREQTDYDENLIWDYVLKNCELGSVIKSLCLYEQIDCSQNAEKIHEDGLNYRIINWKEAGGGFEDISEDYVLIIHMEKDPSEPQALWDSRYFGMTENMMRDEEYIKKVIQLFEKNTRLGVLVPPMHAYGSIVAGIEQRWCNKAYAEKLYHDLDLKVSFSSEKAPVHPVCAVWCRKEVLERMGKKEILENRDGTLLQILPLVAQDIGYYTEIIENADYTRFRLSGMQELVQDMWRLLELSGLEDVTIEECETQIIQRKIKEALCQTREVYIYGAGERAFRVISSIRAFADIRGIVVSNREGNPPQLLGYPVEAMDDFSWNGNGALIVVTVGKQHRKDVLTALEGRGLQNYICV